MGAKKRRPELGCWECTRHDVFQALSSGSRTDLNTHRVDPQQPPRRRFSAFHCYSILYATTRILYAQVDIDQVQARLISLRKDLPNRGGPHADPSTLGMTISTQHGFGPMSHLLATSYNDQLQPVRILPGSAIGVTVSRSGRAVRQHMEAYSKPRHSRALRDSHNITARSFTT